MKRNSYTDMIDKIGYTDSYDKFSEIEYRLICSIDELEICSVMNIYNNKRYSVYTYIVKYDNECVGKYVARKEKYRNICASINSTFSIEIRLLDKVLKFDVLHDKIDSPETCYKLNRLKELARQIADMLDIEKIYRKQQMKLTEEM